MKKCTIDNCERDAVYKQAGLCAPCYQSLYYWGKKSPTQKMKRKRALHVYSARMEVAEPRVTVMRRRAARGAR